MSTPDKENNQNQTAIYASEKEQPTQKEKASPKKAKTSQEKAMISQEKTKTSPEKAIPAQQNEKKIQLV